MQTIAKSSVFAIRNGNASKMHFGADEFVSFTKHHPFAVSGHRATGFDGLGFPSDIPEACTRCRCSPWPRDDVRVHVGGLEPRFSPTPRLAGRRWDGVADGDDAACSSRGAVTGLREPQHLALGAPVERQVGDAQQAATV